MHIIYIDNDQFYDTDLNQLLEQHGPGMRYATSAIKSTCKIPKSTAETTWAW